MFQSQAQRLYAPLTLPEDLQSNLIFGSTKYDISEGDAIESTTDFEKSYNDICNIYCTNQKDNKLRIAITETARGWRGDTYRLYLLDFTITKEEFIKNMQITAFALEKDNKNPAKVYYEIGRASCRERV